MPSRRRCVRATTRAVRLAALVLLCSCDATPWIDEPPADDPRPDRTNPSISLRQLGLAQMPACGSPLVSFDGTVARSNGPSTGTGYACAGQGGIASGLQYQCVELVMRHFKRKWNLRWWGHARTILDNAPPAAVDVRLNGDAAHPPVPGDILVWDRGQWGHAALVTRVSPTEVQIIEQNVVGSGLASLPYDGAAIGVRWGDWAVTGWAHAKANVDPVDAPVVIHYTPAAPSCHDVAVMSWDYCSADCPCSEGEGDCDSDDECSGGLICAQDVGASHGAPTQVDVCQAPPQQGDGPLSTRCAGCDLSTHDCVGHQGGYSCIPRSSSCAPADGYLFRQCDCTGWQFCIKSADGGRWSSDCTDPAPVPFDCL